MAFQPSQQRLRTSATGVVITWLCLILLLSQHHHGVDAVCSDDLIQVNLQLKWIQQPQFAGYIAAYENGYYADECLELNVRPGGIVIDPLQEIVEGRAEFAVAFITSAIQAREQRNYNITNIAQIFRRSQFGEFQWADSNVKSPEDLRGKVVCMWPGEELNLKALFVKYNIKWDDDWSFNKSTGDFDLVSQSFHMKEFLNRNCYSAAAMRYNEWASVLETVDPSTGGLYQESQFTEISFEDQGVASLEDGIFVNNEWLAIPGNRDIAVRFLRASFKGWQFARDFPADTVDFFAQKGAHFTWQMAQINKLVWPTGIAGIGVVEDSLLQHDADLAYNFSLINNRTTISQFYRSDLAIEAQQGIAASTAWKATIYGPGSADYHAYNYTGESLSFCLTAGQVFICSSIRTEGPHNWFDYDSAVGVGIVVITSISIVVVTLLACAIFYYRKHNVIRAASRNFCILMCIGALMGLVSIFAVIGKPSSNMCLSRNWLLGLGFCIFFGSYLLKTYRIHKIFNNARLVSIGLRDQVLLIALAGLTIGGVGLLLLITFVGNLRSETRNDTDDFSRLNTDCVVDDAGTWVLLIYLYFGGMLGYGIYLAAQIHSNKVHSEYNESKFLGFAIYNILLVSLIAVPLSNGAGGIERDAALAIHAIAIILGAWGSLAVLFVPKFMIIWNYEEYQKKNHGGPLSKGRTGQGANAAANSRTEEESASGSMHSRSLRIQEAEQEELLNRKRQIDHMMEMLKEEYEEINKELRGRFRRKTGTDPPPEWLAKNGASPTNESKYNGASVASRGGVTSASNSMATVASAPPPVQPHSPQSTNHDASSPPISPSVELSVSTRANLLPSSNDE